MRTTTTVLAALTATAAAWPTVLQQEQLLKRAESGLLMPVVFETSKTTDSF